MQHELLLRKPFAFFYSGTTHYCPICRKNLKKFIPLPNNDLLCPACGSLARNRRLWNILNSGFLRDGIKVLDFSPSRSLWRAMKSIGYIHYSSTDLSGNFMAEHRYDITAIALPDESIDLVVCYHILEHVPNDAAAMDELYRILKPQGKALIQTPFKEGVVYEDFSITSPEEREKHFGQDDHVRIYSVEGLSQRLQNAGFTIETCHYDADDKYGLLPETVLILTKP